MPKKRNQRGMILVVDDEQLLVDFLRTGLEYEGFEVKTAIDGLGASFIADGHHLAPALLKIAARAKGPDRLLLVTDAMRGAGMPDGTYTFGPPDGTPAIVQGGVARTPDQRRRPAHAASLFSDQPSPSRSDQPSEPPAPGLLCHASCQAGPQFACPIAQQRLVLRQGYRHVKSASTQ